MSELLISRVKNQYEQIQHLIKGLSIDFMYRRHISNKWSIQQNLAHLGRYQEVFWDRIDRILNEPAPVFDRYKAENDPEFDHWAQLDPTNIVYKTKIYRENIAR